MFDVGCGYRLSIPRERHHVFEQPHALGMPQLPQRLGLNLPNALAGHPAADLADLPRECSGPSNPKRNSKTCRSRSLRVANIALTASRKRGRPSSAAGAAASFHPIIRILPIKQVGEPRTEAHEHTPPRLPASRPPSLRWGGRPPSLLARLRFPESQRLPTTAAAREAFPLRASVKPSARKANRAGEEEAPDVQALPGEIENHRT